MTTTTRLAFRLTMFALAAITLAFAFSGVALAAPGAGDTVSPTPHTNQPVYTLPPDWEPAAPEGEPDDPTEPPAEPEPEEPTPTTPPAPEPTLVQPTAEPQPTSAPESQPFATPPATTTDTPAASQPTNTDAVRVAIGAGLAAVLLGGGWLATSLARVMRQERHS